MIKKIILLIVCFSPTIFAANVPCNGTQQKPCIVQDTKKNLPDIKNFRTARELAHQFQGNNKGLEQLWISGSAAPSANGWKAISDIIHMLTRDRVKKIIDLDLRQETHGYLNDNAINLTAQNDGINVGKTRQEILDSEEKWLEFLRKQKIISNVLSPKQFKEQDFTGGKAIPVVSVTSEQNLVKTDGIEYIRLMVPDHMRPHNDDVDRFVDLVKHLPARTWVHIHCRGGDGRTTTFMAMFDMLHNADKASFEEIIQRQAAVSPHYDLSETKRKNLRLTENYKNRLAFLEKFYRFSQDHLQGYEGSWSQWELKH